jgi:Tol biopolymer transport system component
LESSALLRVPDSEESYSPFWSPDGREVAFAAGQHLKRIDLAAGSTQIVCKIPSVFLGGTWSPRGVLLFSAGGQLWTVPVTGGEPKAVEKPDAMRGFEPRILPDGQHYVFTGSAAGSPGVRNVYLASLDSRSRASSSQTATPRGMSRPRGTCCS